MFEQPWWRNLFDNALTVQFEHRMIAYALFALAILHALDAVRVRAPAVPSSAARWWLVAAITLQATLGILTLLQPGADRSRADASGGCDRGADVVDPAARAIVGAKDGS